MKIYCDKWVHEGVCAFTQQGCKYKHEMPMDKATQHQLGLFLGYPMWWKRRQAELIRVQQPQGSPAGGEKKTLGGLVAVAAAAATRGGGGGSGLRNGRVDGDGGDDGVASRRDAAVDVNGGLAASRWSGGSANGNGMGPFANREKLLRPSWRTPDEGVSQRRYAEQALQGYDGAGAGAGAEHHSPTARPDHGPIFTNNSNNNTHPLAWPWEDQSYSSRHTSPTTTQQQQHQPAIDTTPAFNPSCAFSKPPPLFHPHSNNILTKKSHH